MASTLKINNLDTASGSTITVPTGKQVIVTDEGGLRVPGTIIQVISAQGNTTASISGTTITAGGVTASITPKSTSSKIFITYNVTMRFGHTDCGRQALFRKIDSGSYSNIITYSRHVVYQNHSNGSNYQGQFLSFSYVDSPSTTGVLTYSHATDAFGGATSVINPNNANGDIQTWQLMEIAQ